MYSRLGSRRRSEKAIPSIMTLLKFFAAQVLIMSSPEYISISSMPSKRVPRALLDALREGTPLSLRVSPACLARFLT